MPIITEHAVYGYMLMLALISDTGRVAQWHPFPYFKPFVFVHYSLKGGNLFFALGCCKEYQLLNSS
jgi:hypothetical protein